VFQLSFTYNGFPQAFIGKLGGLSERMKRARWCSVTPDSRPQSISNMTPWPVIS